MAGFTSTLTGGLLGNAPDYSRLALRNEKKRKGIIDLGLQQIGAVFEGGQAPFYTLANAEGARFDPKGTYYSLNKGGKFAPYWAPKVAKPGGTFSQSGVGAALKSGGGDLFLMGSSKLLGLDKLFGKSESPKDIARKAFRRGQIFNAPNYQTFKGFGPEFYQARTKAYLDYALPQVAEQYLQARDAQTYGLANRGLLKSSQANRARSNLERTVGASRQAVAEEGINQANLTKRQVEGARSEATNQLYQSADPVRAIQSALASAANLETPTPFSPIANMFAGLAQQYYTNQVLNNYRTGAEAFSGYGLDGGISPYLAPIRV